MAADWPTTLPQSPLIDGYDETPPDLTVRSENATGPAKVRRRATAGVRPVSWNMLLDTTQMTTFDDFFEGTLANGALPFNLKDPRTGLTFEYRIVNKPPYQLESGRLWRVNMQLERLPTGDPPSFFLLGTGDKLLLLD